MRFFSRRRAKEQEERPEAFFIAIIVAAGQSRRMGGDTSKQFIPVSYTHLDVYKRQRWYRGFSALCNFGLQRAFFITFCTENFWEVFGMSVFDDESGCTIYVAVKEEHGKACKIVVSDNGVGATDKQIDKLNNSPHYMVCDENTSEQRHGLGLLIVKQIAVAHKGTVEIRHSEYGGLEVEICLPV